MKKTLNRFPVTRVYNPDSSWNLYCQWNGHIYDVTDNPGRIEFFYTGNKNGKWQHPRLLRIVSIDKYDYSPDVFEEIMDIISKSRALI